ncbi:hypothetical protein K502DRAFT_366457 [Neoconidiobolus thromboides FSU 785]|nr:hypothetical protein K502DRAFT_366457 [Neoconidiobolus thromboides FSU 785]
MNKSIKYKNIKWRVKVLDIATIPLNKTDRPKDDLPTDSPVKVNCVNRKLTKNEIIEMRILSLRDGNFINFNSDNIHILLDPDISGISSDNPFPEYHQNNDYLKEDFRNKVKDDSESTFKEYRLVSKDHNQFGSNGYGHNDRGNNSIRKSSYIEASDDDSISLCDSFDQLAKQMLKRETLLYQSYFESKEADFNQNLVLELNMSDPYSQDLALESSLNDSCNQIICDDHRSYSIPLSNSISNNIATDGGNPILGNENDKLQVLKPLYYDDQGSIEESKHRGERLDLDAEFSFENLSQEEEQNIIPTIHSRYNDFYQNYQLPNSELIFDFFYINHLPLSTIITLKEVNYLLCINADIIQRLLLNCMAYATLYYLKRDLNLIIYYKQQIKVLLIYIAQNYLYNINLRYYNISVSILTMSNFFNE